MALFLNQELPGRGDELGVVEEASQGLRIRVSSLVCSAVDQQMFVYQTFALHLHVNCLSPFQSPKPLPQHSLVFS